MPLNGNLGNKVLPLINSSTLPFEISIYEQTEKVNIKIDRYRYRKYFKIYTTCK